MLPWSAAVEVRLSAARTHTLPSLLFFFSSRRRHTRSLCDWSSDVCSSDLSHDSIGLGEDGPTHQPIEQLAALRAIPNLVLIRPADATETVEAWRMAILSPNGPVALVLTRQKVAVIDRAKYAPANGLRLGGYVLADAPPPRHPAATPPAR